MHRTLEYQFSRLPTDGLFHWQKMFINFTKRKKMADSSKDGLLLAMEYATSQPRRSSRAVVNKFLLAYVILFKRVYFLQYFVCLRERMSNFCNVLLSR